MCRRIAILSSMGIVLGLAGSAWGQNRPTTLLYSDDDRDGEFERVGIYDVAPDVAWRAYLADPASQAGVRSIYAKDGKRIGYGDNWRAFLETHYPQPVNEGDCDDQVNATFTWTCKGTCPEPPGNCSTGDIIITSTIECLNIPPCPNAKLCVAHPERIDSWTFDGDPCACVSVDCLPTDAEVIEFTATGPVCDCELTAAVPAASAWGLMALVVLLLGAASVVLRRAAHVPVKS